MLVADISVLLERPLIQDWKPDGGPWTVVLVPQVLAELDDRKPDQALDRARRPCGRTSSKSGVS